MVSVFKIGIQLIALARFIRKQCIHDSSKAKLLSTKYINDFYEISTIGRNIALSTVLDSVAPFNVTIIGNNSITNKLLP